MFPDIVPVDVPLLGAIACGTPAICSSLKVYKEILQNNAVFVPPNNPQLLAKGIIRLIKDNDFRKNLIDKGQKFVKRYSWDAVGKKLEEAYRHLLYN